MTPTVQQAAHTQFPADPATRSARSALYILNNAYLAGTSLSRWILIVLVAVAILSSVGWFPGRWGLPAVMGAMAAGLLLSQARLRRREFLHFDEGALLPGIEPMRLDPADKISLHASGHFSVEGKSRRFTWLPGFYRTFATREHALLCLARDRRLLGLTRWPADEVGMWYIFFTPDLIQRLHWGTLHFSGEALPGIMITYRVTIPPRNRFASEKSRDEHLYLACANEKDAKCILADLLFDLELET